MFCELTDEDLMSLHDSWMFLSDERGFIGTLIIDELIYLRQLVRDLNADPEFMDPLTELDEIAAP